LIPAGTKGVIRGNKFNSIVQNTITNMKLNNERFEIAFEKQCKSCITSEKPDWYILEKSTDKVIIGMNLIKQRLISYLAQLCCAMNLEKKF
jgi:hypothetical protein